MRPDVVQDSIHAFAFDLEENKKKEKLSGPLLNFFMGILRKGIPYTPPDNYQPSELRAMRKYLEAKKRIAEQAAAIEQEIQTLEFSEWFGKLTQEQKQEFAPGIKGEGPMQKGFLRNYFDEKIWPERRENITHLQR